jgi:hypothetical protein
VYNRGYKEAEEFMEAIIVGLLYALFGVVLLFFGAKFMTVVLGVLGALFGISLGQLLVNWWSMNGAWAFIFIVLCAALLAYLTITFYTYFVASATGYFLGVAAYSLMTTWGASHGWAIAAGIIVALIAFTLIWRLNVVETIFKFITSVQGAIVLVAGVYVMLHHSLLGVLQTNHNDVLLGASTWWVVFWIVAFCAGLGYQLKTKTELATK